jgi:hypothetical protein
MLNILVNNTELSRRKDICKECPEFHAKKVKCRKCGCYINIKGRLKGAKCPLDKW